MKFLHTSDLHIGKRLEGNRRDAEQASVLAEIISIARSERIDLALIAGDVFDVSSPPPEAKKMFYRFALELSTICPVVAIAGNHDNALDLSAAKELAEVSNISLIGSPEQLSLCLGGESTNIAALPYPDDSKLKGYEGEYTERAAAYIAEFCTHFKKSENNILLSHLFLSGLIEDADENALGPARLLPKTVLPDCCYCALGHIHRQARASKSKNAYYSGSPLSYHFDGNNDKSVTIVEMQQGEIIEVRQVPLTSGKKLISISASCFNEAVSALEKNPDALIKIQYLTNQPLSLIESRQLKSYPSFVKLELITTTQEASQQRASMKGRADDELFSLYYQSTYEKTPPDEIMSLFAEIMTLAREGK